MQEKHPFVLSEKQVAYFWSLVEKSEGCWIWSGNVGKDGYGKVTFSKRTLRAHRVSYAISNGVCIDSLGGLLVCHKCDNRLCVSPNHLFSGSQLDNIRDMLSKKRERPPFGENHWNTKVSHNDVLSMRQLYASGNTQASIAFRFGVDQSHVSRVCCMKVRAKS